MFYVAFKHKAVGVFGKLIKLWPFAGSHKYCHVELVFSNGDWFSAREFKNGVSFTKGEVPSDDTIFDYDLMPLPMIGPEEERRLRVWCQEEVGCDYDTRGVIFSFLPIPIGWQHKEKWFCSEICFAALQSLGLSSLKAIKGVTPASVSPGRMHRLLVNIVKVSCFENRCYQF